MISYSHSMEKETKNHQDASSSAPSIKSSKGKGKTKKRLPLPEFRDEHIEIQDSPDDINLYATDEIERVAERNRKYHGSPVRNLNRAFANAPRKAKRIVKHLKNPKKYNRSYYRSAFFIGEPGAGKTTLAKAIGYRVGWRFEFIQCSHVRGKYRGHAATNLINRLNEILESEDQTIVVIDEINRLLENHESAHHDTDEISDTIWGFLDSLEGKENIFLIGTMNRAHRIAEQIKTRAGGRCVKIPALTSLDDKKTSFIFHLDDGLTTLHSECDDEFFAEILAPLQKWSERDFAELSIEILDAYWDENSSGSEAAEEERNYSKVITKAHIREGLARFLDIRINELKVGEQDETDAERQERHFIQHELIQLMLQLNMVTKTSGSTGEWGSYSSTSHELPNLGRIALDGYFTDDQKRIADDFRNRSQGAVKRAQQDAPNNSEGCTIQ